MLENWRSFEYSLHLLYVETVNFNFYFSSVKNLISTFIYKVSSTYISKKKTIKIIINNHYSTSVNNLSRQLGCDNDREKLTLMQVLLEEEAPINRKNVDGTAGRQVWHNDTRTRFIFQCRS